MLYTKGERRYTEASDADILGTAAKTLSRLGMGEQSIWLSGVADTIQALERRSSLLSMASEEVAKRKMLPGAEEVKQPRKGAEPA